MPDSESFDAFYARTVWSVTNRMHALADGDGAADHAIREAYARAYQQWYEISAYPDTEGWVLAVAKEAYQRRRPGAAVPAREPAGTGHDPLSWPGMFRPAAGPGVAAVDSGAAVAAPAGPANRGVGVATGQADDHTVSHISGLFGSPAGRSGGTATAALSEGQPPPPAPPTEPGRPWRPRGPLGAGFGSRRALVALAAAAVLVAGGVAYLAAGRHPSGRAAENAAGTHGKPVVHMLAAGQTGSRNAIPWSIVGPGWTLADVSTARPDANGTATGTGTVTTYLVDPEGGRYQIQTLSGTGRPQLIAWSGDAHNALFAVPENPSGTAVGYDLLSVRTGTFTVLPLPAAVTPVGFTRPDGLNVLAVQSEPGTFQLERFNLQGAYQATIGSLPRKAGVSAWQAGCGGFCGALSSPDGTTAVWGVRGDEMQLVSNVGGLIRKLDVPDSGSPPSCTPLTWWNADTVLAYCAVTGNRYPAGRLWLVPSNGDAPSPLTGVGGTPAGDGVVLGGWHAAGTVYVTATDSEQCPGAASGPGGLAVRRVAADGSQSRITISGTTDNYTSVVSAAGNRLLVLAQTGCPGTSSLLWVNPATGATQALLAGQAGQVGVVAAAPLGLGPTAATEGQY